MGLTGNRLSGTAPSARFPDFQKPWHFRIDSNFVVETVVDYSSERLLEALVAAGRIAVSDSNIVVDCWNIADCCSDTAVGYHNAVVADILADFRYCCCSRCCFVVGSCFAVVVDHRHCSRSLGLH